MVRNESAQNGFRLAYVDITVAGTKYPEEICDHLDNGEYDDIQEYVQVRIKGKC